MKIASIFGIYAESRNLQAMIDLSKERFNQPWFKQYFSWSAQQVSLKYSTIVGRARIDAAASVVDTDASAPLRSRANLEKYEGTVAAIKEKMKMTQSDYRDFLTLQNLPVADSVKKNQLLDLLFNDVLRVGNSVMKRLDIMAMQAVSKGVIDISVSNNPDGIVTGVIDLLMPAENKRTVSKAWSDVDAKPFEDIRGVVNAGKKKGVSFSKMLIPDGLYAQLEGNKSVQETIKGFFNPGSNARYLVTLENVNQYLTARRFPTFELVDEIVGIEKDGKQDFIRPFEEHNVSLVPSGKLGVIHNALAIESLNPVAKVSYANYERALIAKWQENDPFAEYTAVELNAFPGVEAIDSIFLLQTDKVS